MCVLEAILDAVRGSGMCAASVPTHAALAGSAFPRSCSLNGTLSGLCIIDLHLAPAPPPPPLPPSAAPCALPPRLTLLSRATTITRRRICRPTLRVWVDVLCMSAVVSDIYEEYWTRMLRAFSWRLVSARPFRLQCRLFSSPLGHFSADHCCRSGQ